MTKLNSPVTKQLREKQQNSFLTIADYKLPREVIDRIDLMPQDKIVYAILYTISGGEGRRCFIKKEAIAGLVGRNIRMIDLSVNHLKEKGLIVVKNRWRRSNGKPIALPNAYYITVLKRRTDPRRPAVLSGSIGTVVSMINRYFYEIKV